VTRRALANAWGVSGERGLNRTGRRSHSSHPASFPLYWRDWLSSPELRALTPAERSGFMDVLCYTQGTKTVGIYTEEQCRGWAGYTLESWQGVRDKFLALHTVRKDGKWLQKRARRERLAQKIRYNQARAAGKKGASKRWSPNDMNRGAMPAAMAKACPSPDPAPTPVVKQQAMPSTERGVLELVPPRGDFSVAGEIAGDLLARLAGSRPEGSA
jgi:uncharacterized protein YdaU (DUF1376 family)